MRSIIRVLITVVASFVLAIPVAATIKVTIEDWRAFSARVKAPPSTEPGG